MKTLTVENLLTGPQQINIPYRDKEIPVWIRRLTQTERDLCTAYARRASREMRKLLESDTEEHQLLVIEELSEYDRSALSEAWINGKLIERALKIQRESLEARDETYIPEPEGDEVMPADVDRYENAVEETEEQRQQAVTEAITTARKQLEEESASFTFEELRGAAEPAMVEVICGNIFTTEYVAQMITRGTFKDKLLTKPAFKTPDEVKSLHPGAMKLLSESHQGLLIDAEEIKN